MTGLQVSEVMRKPEQGHCPFVCGYSALPYDTPHELRDGTDGYNHSTF